MLVRTISVDIEPTPEELAFEFARMNDTDQAAFFNELARLTSKWDKALCFQLQYITDNDTLTPQARRVMEQIGEYAHPYSG